MQNFACTIYPFGVKSRYKIYCTNISIVLKAESMQRPGTEATRTQIQPHKPKRKTTNATNSQNIKRTHGQQSELPPPKRWPLSNRNRTKNNTNTRKVKHHRNPDTKKTGNREPQQNHHPGTVSNEPPRA